MGRETVTTAKKGLAKTMCAENAGFLTDIDIENALKKQELHLDVQLYGSRDERNADGSDQQGAASINVGNYLADKTIYKDASEKRTRAENFVDKNITPSGLDISFDSFHPVYCVSKRVSLERKWRNAEKKNEGMYIEIPPGATVSVNTREFFEFSDQIASLIQSKVSNVCDGLSHISTTIDPTWKGELLITFTNNNEHPYILRHGDRLATVTLRRTVNPCTRRLDPQLDRNNERWAQYRQEEEEDLVRKRRLKTANEIMFWFPLSVIAVADLVTLWFASEGLSVFPFVLPGEGGMINVICLILTILLFHMILKRFVPLFETGARIIATKFITGA